MLATLRLSMNRALVSRFPAAVDATAVERLRLRVLFAVALLKLFNFIGGAWDIQWHVAIGRDSLWIPPTWWCSWLSSAVWRSSWS